MEASVLQSVCRVGTMKCALAMMFARVRMVINSRMTCVCLCVPESKAHLPASHGLQVAQMLLSRSLPSVLLIFQKETPPHLQLCMNVFVATPSILSQTQLVELNKRVTQLIKHVCCQTPKVNARRSSFCVFHLSRWITTGFSQIVRSRQIRRLSWMPVPISSIPNALRQ